MIIDFGSRLKKLRIQSNMSQAQLAERLGVTKAVVSAYETSIRMPSYDILLKISRIFKVTTDYLLGNERREVIDMSGLTDEEIAAIKNLIKAIKTS